MLMKWIRPPLWVLIYALSDWIVITIMYLCICHKDWQYSATPRHLFIREMPFFSSIGGALPRNAQRSPSPCNIPPRPISSAASPSSSTQTDFSTALEMTGRSRYYKGGAKRTQPKETGLRNISFFRFHPCRSQIIHYLCSCHYDWQVFEQTQKASRLIEMPFLVFSVICNLVILSE